MVKLSEMPRRPSEILGIDDPTEALLLDIEILSAASKEVSAPVTTKEKIMRRWRQLGII